MPERERSRIDPRAAMSLLLGISALALSIFTGIPAVILGHMSRASIRKSAGQLTGEAMAMGGLIMGYISIVLLPVLCGVVYVAVPNLFRTAIASNESRAEDTLKKLRDAIEGYKYEHGEYPANLEELGAASLVSWDKGLTSTGVKDGYHFSYNRSSTKGYVIRAEPIFVNTGEMHYYLDNTGIIHFDKTKTAGPGSDTLGTD